MKKLNSFTSIITCSTDCVSKIYKLSHLGNRVESAKRITLHIR